MKKRSQDFKDKIKEYGRQIDSKITYGEVTLEKKDLNAVTPVLQSSLLKSVMKELDIDSNIEIPVGTILNYKFGVLLDSGDYEYLDYGNYQVYSSEKQEDTNSYNIVAYDKMLNSMVEYTTLKSSSSFPMSVRDYILYLCRDIKLNFADYNKEFANYDKMIPNDLYANLGYTYRDIFDELAQITASNIIINENDEVAIKYIEDTEDIIDESFLKDINVAFGQKYGPINSIVLSRSAGTDNIYLRDEQSIIDNGLCELKISDNQIMNFNDRSDYLPAILNKLNGLEYYINDFTSTGVCYYEVADKYNVKIGETIYPCVMFNDEIDITTGLEEKIYTDLPEQAETDYTKADKTDRKLNQTYLIVDKQNQTIESVVSQVDDQNEKISQIEQTVDEIKQQISNITDLTISGETNYAKIDIYNVGKGFIAQLIIHPYRDNISGIYPSNDIFPSDDTFMAEQSGNVDIAITHPNNNLYPSNKTFMRTTIGTLRITDLNTREFIDYEIPTDLYYLDENTYDILEYKYSENKCVVTRNVEFKNGVAYKKDTPTTEEYDFPMFETEETNYSFELLDYDSGYIYVKLLGKNDYTDIFATKVELRSSITQTEDKIELEVQNLTEYIDGSVSDLDSKFTQTADSITAEINKKIGEDEAKALIKETADEINLEVSKKVGEDEIISKINQSAERIQIEANKISLEGKTIQLTSDDIEINSNNFSVDRYGNLSCSNADMDNLTINGGSIKLDPNTFGDGIIIGDTSQTIELKYGRINFLKSGTQTASITSAGTGTFERVNVTGTLQIGLNGNIDCLGSLSVQGAKHRIVEIDNGEKVLLNAYETATPYFGDIGSNFTNSDGYCKILIEDIFSQTIELENYKVFIQECGDGHLYVKKHGKYFEVLGTPNLEFDWEIKAIQKGYKNVRLEKYKRI